VWGRGATEDVPRPKDGSGYVVAVDVWLDGKIELEKLEVPADMVVESGGEIGEFIEEHNSKKTERPDRQQNVLLRGAAASCRDLYLDIDDETKVQQIGGATSSRCLHLAKEQAPAARWKLIETERGHLIQARLGEFAGWYLDFDDDGKIEQLSGATSSRNLLLTKEKVPGAYWKVTETDEGHLIQAQAGRFDGWYLDLDLLTKEKVEGAFWEFAPAQADTAQADTAQADTSVGEKHAPG